MELTKIFRPAYLGERETAPQKSVAFAKPDSYYAKLPDYQIDQVDLAPYAKTSAPKIEPAPQKKSATTKPATATTVPVTSKSYRQARKDMAQVHGSVVKAIQADQRATNFQAIRESSVNPTQHTVKTGQTVSDIAKAHQLSLQKLKAYNPQLQNLNRIQAGQTLFLTAQGKSEGAKAATPQPTDATPKASETAANAAAPASPTGGASASAPSPTETSANLPIEETLRRGSELSPEREAKIQEGHEIVRQQEAAKASDGAAPAAASPVKHYDEAEPAQPQAITADQVAKLAEMPKPAAAALPYPAPDIIQADPTDPAKSVAQVAKEAQAGTLGNKSIEILPQTLDPASAAGQQYLLDRATADLKESERLAGTSLDQSDGRLSRQELTSLFAKPSDFKASDFANKYLQAFDLNKDGYIDWQENQRHLKLTMDPSSVDYASSLTDKRTLSPSDHISTGANRFFLQEAILFAPDKVRKAVEDAHRQLNAEPSANAAQAATSRFI